VFYYDHIAEMKKAAMEAYKSGMECPWNPLDEKAISESFEKFWSEFKKVGV
jgi:hypothetical protein